jgi:hypothetical protein
MIAEHGCSSADEHSERAARAEVSKPLSVSVTAPVAVTDTDQHDTDQHDLPFGEAPPPPGTHFIDISRATTRERASYPDMQYILPSAAWPPVAYRHGLGLRVRWWDFSWCGPSHVRVVLRGGVLTFFTPPSPPRHCAPPLIEYETTLPPGNDGVHAVRGPGGTVPLPDVLGEEPPRRAPRRSGFVLDPWLE